jgi:hypothetical protein
MLRLPTEVGVPWMAEFAQPVPTHELKLNPKAGKPNSLLQGLSPLEHSQTYGLNPPDPAIVPPV